MSTRAALCSVCCTLALLACGPDSSVALSDVGDELATAQGAVDVPSWNSPAFDVATWNVFWFGKKGLGPSDVALQLANVRDVMRGASLDLWGLVEVADADAFAALVRQLPGTQGLLANDPRVQDGARYYHRSEQKPALVWREDVVRLVSAKLVLTEAATEFGGRPPLEAELAVTQGASTVRLFVVVAHLKAMVDLPSWERRQRCATRLKAYLDRAHADDEVLVLGDFNDGALDSPVPDVGSPFAAWVADTEGYTWLTEALERDGGRTNTSGRVIDHVVASNELAPRWVPGSTRVLRADKLFARYATTTTDHFPVVTSWTVDPTPTLALTHPRGGERWLPGASQQVRWGVNAVARVDVEWSADGRTWAALARGVAAGTGALDVTVPLWATDVAQVRVRSEQLADVSGVFTVRNRVALNEVLANEPGNTYDAEFVELVNLTDEAVDLSGFTLSDKVAVRHTFAAGSVLEPGAVLVVVGGPRGLAAGGAGALVASSGSLSLDNRNDVVELKDVSGATVDRLAYGDGGADGVSLTRSTQGLAGASWDLHTSLFGAERSPGTLAAR